MLLRDAYRILILSEGDDEHCNPNVVLLVFADYPPRDYNRSLTRVERV
jgi:hypothetical protein